MALTEAQLDKTRAKVEEISNHDAMSVRITLKGKIVFQLRYRYDAKQQRINIGPIQI